MARMAIRMPKMSMTMTEGDVGTWHAKVGDEIAVGDVVAEVMTDKVDMEVESTVAGTLVEIVHAEGTVPVGEPMAWVEGEDDGGSIGDLFDDPTDEAADEPADEPADVEPPAEPTTSSDSVVPATTSDDVRHDDPQSDDEPATGPTPAVPRARALAREHGVDLAAVAGSGPDGLVTVADVEQALPRTSSESVAPAATSHDADRRTAVRKVVARTMTPSAAIPQFTVWRTLRLDAADVQRAGASWTTVLLRAYSAALREVPELLSRWEDDGPTEPGPPAVALAVATDRGLLVPTFEEPDLGSATERDQQVRQVVASAQHGKVDRAFMGAANASLSNLGGLGVDRFQALLTPPQASVLSLGSIAHRPVAVAGGIGSALCVEAGLTVDHRVADGVHAARLLAALADRLDAPV